MNCQFQSEVEIEQEKNRRAFAQGVSDHQKMNCQHKSDVEIEQVRITTIEHPSSQQLRNGIEMSSCSCFLLRLLFLAQIVVPYSSNL